MLVSTVKAAFPADIHKVWDVILDVRNYTWRSDLSRTVVVSEKRFIEYTKKNFPTAFTVTAVEPYRRWELDMENDNMKGHWIGVFTSKGNGTEIEFTEHMTVNKPILRPLAKLFLKKQQERFVSDLIKALTEERGTKTL